MRPSPLQVVKKKFESKAKLVQELVSKVDRLNGDTTDDQVKSRLMGLSNKKLLRLALVDEAVRQQFGDREKLVAHIVESRKTAGLTVDESYKAKLATYSKARLLDLTKQKLGERPAKQTAEQKLKNKRGRKARERALAAIAKKK